MEIFCGKLVIWCNLYVHFKGLVPLSLQKSNIFALKHTYCTEISNDLNFTDTKKPLISMYFLMLLLY